MAAVAKKVKLVQLSLLCFFFKLWQNLLVFVNNHQCVTKRFERFKWWRHCVCLACAKVIKRVVNSLFWVLFTFFANFTDNCVLSSFDKRGLSLCKLCVLAWISKCCQRCWKQSVYACFGNCQYLLGFVKFLLVVVKVTNVMTSVLFGLFVQMWRNLLKTVRFDFM